MESHPRAREYMQSLAEGRHKQALKFWRIWKDLQEERQPEHWTSADVDRAKAEAVKKIAELCAVEISEAFNDSAWTRMTVDGIRGVAYSGTYRAMQTVADEHQRSISQQVKFCVTQVFEELKEQWIGSLRSLKAEELLTGLQKASREDAVAVIVCLTDQQRSDLAALLHDQINDDLVILLDTASEPIDKRMWLFRYLYLSDLLRSEVGPEVGRFVFTVRRGAIPTNRRGEIVMPLGPMYAKVFEAQKREMNKLGMLPKNPGTKKIAESLKADHSSVTRWLKEDLPLKLEPDGNGGVHYTFNLSTIQRCIEITAGKKRGPKSKNK